MLVFMLPGMAVVWIGERIGLIPKTEESLVWVLLCLYVGSAIFWTASVAIVLGYLLHH